MTEVYFQDTTIRDGAQSLWAYNIRTGMIEPICEYLDRIGFTRRDGDIRVLAEQQQAE